MARVDSDALPHDTFSRYLSYIDHGERGHNDLDSTPSMDGCARPTSDGVHHASVDAIYFGHTELPSLDNSINAIKYMDTLLLHHMAPHHAQITRSIGTTLWQSSIRKPKYTTDKYDPATFIVTPESPKVELLVPRRPGNLCFALPLALRTETCSTTILVCPDSGSNVNVMSDDIARALGCYIQDDICIVDRPVLANGRDILPKGWTIASCALLGRESTEKTPISCHFYVLDNVPSAIIMGMPFLEECGVLTKHRDMLVKVQRSSIRPATVLSVGKPDKQLLCELNHILTVVVPDSGSEIDLMSPKFAIERGFDIHPVHERIQFADGSTAVCTGFVRTTVSVGIHFDTEGFPQSKVATSADFFLLEGLTHDVLLGEHSVEELKVYLECQHALITMHREDPVAKLHRIRLLGAIDKTLVWFKTKLGKEPRSTDATENAVLARDQQRENFRREQEENRIALLPVNEQAAARILEDSRQNLYNSKLQAITSSSDSSSHLPRSHPALPTNM